MDKKIKILRIINRFNLGGPTYNVSYLSKFLPEKYETILAGGKEEEYEASSLFIPESMGLKPIQIKSLSRKINLFDDIRAFFEIYKLIKKHKPQILHTHASKAGFLGRLAGVVCGVPIIVHTFHGHVFRNYFSQLKTRLIISIERFLARFTDIIVAISEEQKKDLCKEFRICKEEKCRVIKLGFDLNRFDYNENKRQAFREKYGIGKEEIALGIIGRLAPIKNHELFIRSISDLKKKGIKFKSFIIGDGELKEVLIQKCKSEGLILKNEDSNEYDICFTGWIKDVSFCLAGIDIVCLTSKNEGTPVSLIEAQAAGKIVVSTNVGGVKDIKFSDYFFITEKPDFADFSELLLKAIHQMQNTRPTEFKTSSEKIKAEYHYTRLVKDMEILYEELIQKKLTQ
ncbi:MAG: glycosyltransferase [Bacteroidia bacterium]|nr:glycosyltransferase [Bacteroidia bacterium]